MNVGREARDVIADGGRVCKFSEWGRFYLVRLMQIASHNRQEFEVKNSMYSFPRYFPNVVIVSTPFSRASDAC